MGQGLFSLFFVVFGTVLIQAYIYRCHIIPPWLGGDNVTPLYVSWDEYSSGRVSHALVDTRFECGLRLPKALWACEWFACRTRFECSQGGIMSQNYIHFGTIITRGSRTRGPSVASGSQKPFGPVSGSHVASSPVHHRF